MLKLLKKLRQLMQKLRYKKHLLQKFKTCYQLNYLKILQNKMKKKWIWMLKLEWMTWAMLEWMTWVMKLEWMTWVKTLVIFLQTWTEMAKWILKATFIHKVEKWKTIWKTKLEWKTICLTKKLRKSTWKKVIQVQMKLLLNLMKQWPWKTKCLKV